MATSKDWLHVEGGHHYHLKKKTHITIGEIGYNNSEWFVNIQGTKDNPMKTLHKRFNSKPQALKFANSYMRKH